MIRFANIYSDNMIFQQGKPIILWGFCDKEETVYAEIIENENCIANGIQKNVNGKWNIILDALGVKRNLEVIVKCGDECIALRNIAVGDVWLCSGQSNIECGFDYCVGTEKYFEKFGISDIRFMNIEPAISFEEKEDAQDVKWVQVDNNTALPLSVVSCVFGQYLAENLDIPIGLVKNYRGGNSIITFLSEENIKSCDEYVIFSDQLERERKELKSAWSMIPSAFYNAMTAPLSPFSFKGVLWYQGETDSAYGRPKFYKGLLKKLIMQWREQFNDSELPVILVQLCPFEMDPFNYKLIRQIQLEVSKEDKNVHLVVTADLGPTGEDGESPIHPKYKTPIGERCAMAALGAVYQKCEEEWSGPIIERIERNRDELVLYFSHCGSGLISNGELSGFEAGMDDFFINSVAAEIVDNDKVIIKAAQDVTVIRYSYVNMLGNKGLGGNLTNDTNIPASPFEIIIDGDIC